MGVVTPLRGVGVGVAKADPSGSVSRAHKGEFWNCPCQLKVELPQTSAVFQLGPWGGTRGSLGRYLLEVSWKVWV